ncbi:hypothetical protein FGB62_77g016 [Gracilaria domingensis]|nr:hypothetical protein FGB62_77g016 [Gracilaria domingensis]
MDPDKPEVEENVERVPSKGLGRILPSATSKEAGVQTDPTGAEENAALLRLQEICRDADEGAPTSVLDAWNCAERWITRLFLLERFVQVDHDGLLDVIVFMTGITHDLIGRYTEVFHDVPVGPHRLRLGELLQRYNHTASEVNLAHQRSREWYNNVRTALNSIAPDVPLGMEASAAMAAITAAGLHQPAATSSAPLASHAAVSQAVPSGSSAPPVQSVAVPLAFSSVGIPVPATSASTTVPAASSQMPTTNHPTGFRAGTLVRRTTPTPSDAVPPGGGIFPPSRITPTGQLKESGSSALPSGSAGPTHTSGIATLAGQDPSASSRETPASNEARGGRRLVHARVGHSLFQPSSSGRGSGSASQALTGGRAMVAASGEGSSRCPRGGRGSRGGRGGTPGVRGGISKTLPTPGKVIP